MKNHQNHYNTSDGKNKIEIRKIPISQLVSDQPYQREKFNPATVKKILREFDERKIGTLKTSFRKGKYYVYDGQHRLSALLTLFPLGDYAVPCNVQELTYQEEARYFAEQKDIKATQTAYHTYIGHLEAGTDDVVQIESILRSLALKIGSCPSKDTVSCVAKIRNIFKRDTAFGLREKLSLVKKTWCGDEISLSNKIIGGVSMFYDTYKSEFSETQFIDALRRVSPRNIIREGDSDIVAKGDVKYAKAIWNKYNYKRRARLEYKFKG